MSAVQSALIVLSRVGREHEVKLGDGYSRRNHSGALLPATVFTVTFTQPLAVPWGTLTLTFVELQLT